MPSFILYSFADFGVTDNSFGIITGQTLTLNPAATADTLHLALDNDPQLDTDAIGDLDQVLTADLYLDGVLVGSAGDLITASGTTLGVWTDSAGVPGQAIITSISVNGVPIGFATDAPIAAGYEITQHIVVGAIPIKYTSLKCFTKGTMIACIGKARPVEFLQAGDLVHTKNNGLQPVRWIYRQTVSGLGPLAPICIKAGALENTSDLVVSPMHRMLLQGPMAEVLFGAPAFLAHAKDLCDGHLIFPKPSREITYYHILFDQHELVNAHGCWSESFAASSAAMDGMEQAVIDELHAIFPHLSVEWKDALPTLTAAETALLKRGITEVSRRV